MAHGSIGGLATHAEARVAANLVITGVHILSDPISIAPVQQAAAISRGVFTPEIRTARINDYLLCFYDGRDISRYPDWLQSNIDMQLGVCCYVLHRGNRAIVFDTMLYKEQMIWIDDYLRQMGIVHFTVINSHWDCDHIAGNFLYKGSAIISTAKTRWKIESNADMFRTGEIWALAGDPHYPGIDDLVLPNCTFDGRMTLYLDDIEITLIETHIHQLGHLVAYLPRDGVLLTADACEDTVPYNGPSMTADIPLQIMSYRQLQAIPARHLYPSHGRFEVIANGGYSQEFTAAMIDYNVQLLERVYEPGFKTAPLESFIQRWLENGTLSLHEPYRALHAKNVALAERAFGGRSRPIIPL